MKYFIRIFIFYIVFYPFCISANGCSESAWKQDTVLHPWTPMEVKRNQGVITVECWGRLYTFESGLFPTQINSMGVDILNNPMSLDAVYRNEELEWAKTPIKVINSSEDKVELEGSIISKSSFGRIEISSKIQIEYDGLMLISLTSNFPKDHRPDSIRMSIPYKSSGSDYYLRWIKSAKDTYSETIPNLSEWITETNFVPYFWVGNDDRGLFWFCESARFWPNAKSKSAIQLKKNRTEVVQIFNLGPTNKFQFGLQATPVKPMREDAVNWRIAGSYNSRQSSIPNTIIIWPNPGAYNSIKYFGLPMAVNDSIYKERVEKYHNDNQKVLGYAAVTRIPANSPLYINNRNNWRKGPIIKNQKEDNPVYIDPNSNGFIDSLVQNFALYLDRYKLDGYYLDGMKLRSVFRDDDGERYFPILKYRELLRGLYKSIKERDPNNILITHMSANMNIPVLSFSDAYVNGEQFRYFNEQGKIAYKVKDSYLDVLSLGQFRAEFIGKQWGITPIFLPEVDPNDRNNVQPTRGLAALLLLHGVHPWITASNIQIWEEMYRQLDMFGLQDAKFIPYYSSSPPATAKASAVYVSAYRKKNGQVLLIVSNLSKKEVSCDINLNLNVLGLTRVTQIRSVADMKQVALKRSALHASIEASGYRMFLIE